MNVSVDKFRLYVERIERMEEEKKGISDDIRDTYTEMKGDGFDAKITRQIIKLRAMTPDGRAEMDAVLETYRNAINL